MKVFIDLKDYIVQFYESISYLIQPSQLFL